MKKTIIFARIGVSSI